MEQRNPGVVLTQSSDDTASSLLNESRLLPLVVQNMPRGSGEFSVSYSMLSYERHGADNFRKNTVTFIKDKANSEGEIAGQFGDDGLKL